VLAFGQLRATGEPCATAATTKSMNEFPRSTTDTRDNGTSTVESRFVTANGIRLHYMDHAGERGPLVFLHGLSANAHSFDELIGSGLSPAFRALALDLRGRGHSQKGSGYTFEEHSDDVIAWLDALGLQEVILVGHSFGGFLATFIAWRHPSRVRKLIVLDIAASALRDPRVGELLKPSLGRLTRSWSSRDEYIEEMKAAPFLSTWWSSAIERYFQSDAEVGSDGQVRSLTELDVVVGAAGDVARLNWTDIFAAVSQPVLLFHALDRFGPEGATPLVLPEDAQATASLVRNCHCLAVEGNHITMLFGNAASTIAAGIAEFAETEAVA
jgi:pimeloyl-ACP methyl ester carboxylesterase